jgi:hypothetical protein
MPLFPSDIEENDVQMPLATAVPPPPIHPQSVNETIRDVSRAEPSAVGDGTPTRDPIERKR